MTAAILIKQQEPAEAHKSYCRQFNLTVPLFNVARRPRLGHVVVTRPNDLKKMKSLHGLTRTLIQNMVIGVSQDMKKLWK